MKQIGAAQPRSRGAAESEDSLAVRLSVLAAVLVAVGAVAAYEEFTAQALLAGGLIALGSWISHRRRRANNVWLKVAIAVAVLAVARDFMMALIANPYDPRIALVRLFLWLQALHSLDLPRRRDLKYALISAVVLMAVGAAYARDMAFGLWLIPFTAAVSIALVTMQVAANSSAPSVRPKGSDALGRSEGIRLALRMGGALALAAMMVAAGLFVAVPRAEGYRTRGLPVSQWLAKQLQFQGRIVNPAYPDAGAGEPGQAPPVFNPTGYIGFSTHVDLRLRGELSHDLVMRVRATQPAFWRGLAFDEYTGVGWRMSDPSVTEFQAVSGRVVLRFSAEEPWPAGSEQVIQTFYIEAEQPNVIFGAYRTAEVYFPSGRIDVDRYVGLRSPIPLEQGIVYSVISRVPAPGVAMLRTADRQLPPAIAERYLALPSIPARVQALADELTAGQPTAFDKAAAIRHYLARYRYTLQAPPVPRGADAVDDFLFTSRQGSCEAFASAMVVLLRAAGVPARLVTGYTTGTYNFLTGYYEVYNSDAHAWVEVYLPRAGWVEFEPTPGFTSPADLPAGRPGQWLAADAGKWLAGYAQAGWSWVTAGARDVWARTGRDVVPWSVTAGILAAAVVLVRRRGRPSPSGRRQVVGDVYARMLRTLAHAGFARLPSQTPAEFAAGLPEAVRSPAQVITEAFELSRYAGLPPSSARRDELLHLLRALRHSASLSGRGRAA